MSDQLLPGAGKDAAQTGRELRVQLKSDWRAWVISGNREVS